MALSRKATLTPRAGPVARARGNFIPTPTPLMFATVPLHQKVTRLFRQVGATSACRALAVGFPKLLISNTIPLVRSFLTSADDATAGVLPTKISAAVQRTFKTAAVPLREHSAVHPSPLTPTVVEVIATSNVMATTGSPETPAYPPRATPTRDMWALTTAEEGTVEAAEVSSVPRSAVADATAKVASIRILVTSPEQANARRLPHSTGEATPVQEGTVALRTTPAVAMSTAAVTTSTKFGTGSTAVGGILSMVVRFVRSRRSRDYFRGSSEY